MGGSATSQASSSTQPSYADRLGSPGQASNKRPRPDEEGSFGLTPQHQQPQIHSISFDYCTALHLAAYYGHWPVINLLAESSNCDPVRLFAARNAQAGTLSCHCVYPRV